MNNEFFYESDPATSAEGSTDNFIKKDYKTIKY